MQNIIWLASYPKSGNTWFRVFLTNLLNPGNKPADINHLEKTPIASSREIFDQISGLNASDLSPAEIDLLRPEVYTCFSKQVNETCFLKIHDAYRFVAEGIPLIPQEASRGVIYILRNPLDLVVSLANHMGSTLDKAIQQINDENFSFSKSNSKLNSQLPQKLLSWSGHVQSWLDLSNLAVQMIRYEDMHMQRLPTFSKVVRFMGFEASLEEIEKALKFSEFKELKKQESQKGFNEKPLRAESFFKRGAIGYGRRILSASQIKTIIKVNWEIMERFGYLDQRGNPVF